jgi:hypothetical protein
VSAASCERRSRSPNNAQRGQQFASRGNPPPPNRRWMSDVLTPKAPRAGGFPKAPAPTPPRVYSVRRCFSAPGCSQHTGSPALMWCVRRPISTFQRHIAHAVGISSVIRYWHPSSCHLALGSRVLAVAGSLLPRLRACHGTATGHRSAECPFRFCSTCWV